MIKRLMDILVSCLALTLFFIPMFIIGSLIAVSLGRPILFVQLRPGLHGRPFNLIKFRTMTDAKGIDGEPLSDSARLTSFGKWLRSTSLDELPSLWNVLKGDMSLVGPRPLLMEYLPLYCPREALRHNVKPGITGWAQVNGRNTVNWTEKFEFDVWYVKNMTIWLDIKILLLTVIKVVRREGINAVGETTMPKFTGGSIRVEDDGK